MWWPSAALSRRRAPRQRQGILRGCAFSSIFLYPCATGCGSTEPCTGRPRGERFPVLLIRSPYSTQHPRYVEWARRFVAEGYAVLMQDSRGRYESEDEWRPYVDERDDGYDTQQWIGQQPWCDGTIGTFGVSYPGFTPAPGRRRCVVLLSKPSCLSPTKRTTTATCATTAFCSCRTP